nr:DUF4445 domain-containing protein [Desulfobacterales bacterium]
MDRVTVVFQPSGRRGEVSKGSTILEAVQEIGESIESLCGGKGICGKCKVVVSDGHNSRHGIVSERRLLSPEQEPEALFVNNDGQQEGFRLACCTTIQDDLSVFIPEESRVFRQVVSKHPRLIPVDRNPAVKKYYLKLSEPSDKDPEADLERVLASLKNQYGLKDIDCDIDAIRKLPGRLRKKNWEVTVSIWMDKEIVRVRPGRALDNYGIAVDIGTTTVAASLVHLNSMKIQDTRAIMNPQIKYGEDVISRINYHGQHKGGLQKMSADIIDALNDLIQSMLRATWPDQKVVSEIDRDFGENGPKKSPAEFPCLHPEDIEDVTIVGNTVMHHILLQIDPKYVGLSPFPPAVRKGLYIKARTLGIHVCPSAYVHILPNEAGFVGADNVGVLIAETPYESDQVHLIIDIGTNGELVIGNRKRLMSTSCATGPVFEGSHITFGMRAAPGAIEHIRIDPESHEVIYKVVASDVWSNYASPGELKTRGICGSGILEILAELYRAGIITRTGVFRREQKSPRYRINPDIRQPEFVIAWARETAIGRDITITQKDIRQIQLAKAAIYSGCKLLMRRWGVKQVDVIKIAGGFGIHTDPIKVLIMGMIPDCDPRKIVAVGNSAGAGALAALLNRDKRAEANWVARNVEYIDLARDNDFQEEFIDAMYIPHMKDPFPHLESILLPEILYQQ